MKTVGDLRKFLDKNTRVGVATIILNAIVALKMPDTTEINGDTLGEVRSMIYERGRKPDRKELLFAAVNCDTGNPIEEALTLVERIALKPGHEFWTS